MTTPVPSVDLRPDHWAIVRDALRRHVPDREVVAFGSRATWTAKDYSDLDLAVMGEEPLSLRTAAALDEALGDSDLPFKVDVVDWTRIDDSFRAIIQQHGVVIQCATGSSKEKGAKHPSVPDAEGWREARLSELVRFLSGGTPSKKCAAYWNGEIPWVSAKEMKQFRLRDTTAKVTVEALANGAKRVPAGTVLLLTRGMRLLKEVPVCVLQQPMTFNQDIKALEPIGDVDPGFLPYLLLGNTERLRNLVDLAGHGTGRINTDELGALGVRLPPTREQHAIAQILGTLDDKIEWNRRMNETLETMARALFKSWFVDFDPVRAKVEDRNTRLPPNIADLFPDRLVDSEMGEVPKRWEVSEIGKEVNAVGGSTPSTKEPSYWHDGQRYWATPRDLSKLWSPVLLETSRKITDEGLQKISSGTLPVGTVLMSSRAPIGYLAIAEVPTAVNQGFIAMRCDQRLPNLYVLFWCYQTLGHIRDIAGGSTFAEISKKAFRPVSVVVPSEPILRVFDGLCRPLYDRLVVNTKEAVTLAALRDTLLPKLISGEIRVPDAERALESAT